MMSGASMWLEAKAGEASNAASTAATPRCRVVIFFISVFPLSVWFVVFVQFPLSADSISASEKNGSCRRGVLRCLGFRCHARDPCCGLKLLLFGRKQRFDVFVRFLEPVPRVLLGPRLGRDHRRVKEQPGIRGAFGERLFHLALGFLQFAGGGQRPCQ